MLSRRNISKKVVCVLWGDTTSWCPPEDTSWCPPEDTFLCEAPARPRCRRVVAQSPVKACFPRGRVYGGFRAAARSPLSHRIFLLKAATLRLAILFVFYYVTKKYNMNVPI